MKNLQKMLAVALLGALPLMASMCGGGDAEPETPPYDPLPPSGEWRAAKGHIIGYNYCSDRFSSEASDWLILTDQGDSLFTLTLRLDTLYDLPRQAFRDSGCYTRGILCPDYLRRYPIEFEYRRSEPEELKLVWQCLFDRERHRMARAEPQVVVRNAVATQK